MRRAIGKLTRARQQFPLLMAAPASRPCGPVPMELNNDHASAPSTLGSRRWDPSRSAVSGHSGAVRSVGRSTVSTERSTPAARGGAVDRWRRCRTQATGYWALSRGSVRRSMAEGRTSPSAAASARGAAGLRRRHRRRRGRCRLAGPPLVDGMPATLWRAFPHHNCCSPSVLLSMVMKVYVLSLTDDAAEASSASDEMTRIPSGILRPLDLTCVASPSLLPISDKGLTRGWSCRRDGRSARSCITAGRGMRSPLFLRTTGSADSAWTARAPLAEVSTCG